MRVPIFMSSQVSSQAVRPLDLQSRVCHFSRVLARPPSVSKDCDEGVSTCAPRLYQVGTPRCALPPGGWSVGGVCDALGVVKGWFVGTAAQTPPIDRNPGPPTLCRPCHCSAACSTLARPGNSFCHRLAPCRRTRPRVALRSRWAAVLARKRAEPHRQPHHACLLHRAAD